MRKHSPSIIPIISENSFQFINKLIVVTIPQLINRY